MISATTLFSAALLSLPLAGSVLAQEVEKLHVSSYNVQIHYPEPIALFSADLGPNYIANEIASLSLGEIAKVAAEELKIDAQVIRDALTVTPVEGTDFAWIVAKTTDPALSKSIVHGIIQTYVSNRSQRERDIAVRRLSALDDEVVVQGDLVQEHRKELVVLTQQYGIPYFEGSGMDMGRMTETHYQACLDRLTNLEGERLLPQAQLETLKNGNEENLVMTAIAIEIPGNSVGASYEKSLESAAEVSSMLANGLADDEPSVVAQKTRALQTTQDVKKAILNLKGLLEAKLQILDRQIEKCTKAADEAQQNAVELSIKQYNYTQSRRRYEAARDFYEQLSERQQEARVALRMPKTPLTIRERTE